MNADDVREAAYELRRVADLLADERRQSEPLYLAPAPVADPEMYGLLADWLDSVAGAHFHVGDKEFSAWGLPGTEHDPAMRVARRVVALVLGRDGAS